MLVNTSNAKANQMISSLTAFRFITALFVFLFHCNIHFGWVIGISIVDKFIRNGAVFMTGFFVLSGFLMAYNYGNQDFSKRENIVDFYLKRVARIYPVYIISHIVYFLIFFHRFLFKDVIRSLFNNLVLVQGFFPTMFNIGINGGSWSLTVEMFLYFLFPFIVLLLGNEIFKSNIQIKHLNQIPLIVTIAFVLGFVTSLNLLIHQDGDYIYANPVFRISDFLYGIGFYIIRQNFHLAKKLEYILHFIILIVLFFLTVLLGNSDSVYMKGQLFIAPIFAIWIVLVFYSKSWFYNNKVLAYLGEISYSFYLWQFIVIELGKKLVKHHFDGNLVMISMLCLNILVSAMSYHFLEKRCKNWISNKIKRHSNSSFSNNL